MVDIKLGFDPRYKTHRTIDITAENAGEEGSVVVNFVKTSKKGMGYDAEKNEFGEVDKNEKIQPK